MESKGPEAAKQRQRLRIILFLVFSVVSIGLILHFTVTDETIDAFRAISGKSILRIVGVWFVFVLADAASTLFFSRGTEEKIGFLNGLKLVFIRIFFALITPFNFGGQPFMIYSLHKDGVPPGKATSIVITKLLMLSVFVLSATATAMFIGRNKVVELKSLNFLFYLTGIVQVVVMALIFFTLLYPQLTIGVITWVGKLSKRIRRNKVTQGRFKHLVIHEAYLARKSFKRFFSKHIGYFIGGTVAGGVQFLAMIFLLYVVLHAFMPDLPVLDGYVLSALLLFLLSFMPTPGASGLGELLFVVLFGKTVPTHILGIAVVMWRFFFNYLGALFGAVISLDKFSSIIVKKRKGETSYE